MTITIDLPFMVLGVFFLLLIVSIAYERGQRVAWEVAVFNSRYARLGMGIGEKR